MHDGTASEKQINHQPDWGRALGRFVFGNLFRICVLALPPLVAFGVVFGTPDTIKQLARESGMYDSAIKAVLDQSAESPDNSGDSKNILKDPDIRLAVAKSFPSNDLQSASENIIDGSYAWLSGASDRPTFRVDLTEQKNSLINNLTEYATTKASRLPACTSTQLRELGRNMPDVLNLPCLPPGVNPKTVGAQFASDNLSENEFLKDPVFTMDDLPKDTGGRMLHQQLASAPVVFRWLNRGGLLATTGLILGGALYVLSGNNRRKAIRHCATVLVITGGFLLVAVLVYGFLIKKGENLLGGSVVNVEFRDSLNAFLLNIARHINNILGYVSGMYVIIGLTVLVIFRNQKQAVQAADATNTPSVVASDNHTIDDAPKPDNYKEE